ncbi:MAG: DUF6273 domain-containing protein [Eubacteriales bacterium]
MRKPFIALSLFFCFCFCFILGGIISRVRAEDTLEAGDTIYFGSYEQDGDVSNGSEKIKWRVLDIDGESNRALVISSWILDVAPYNDESGDTTWESSYLRSWLNSYFFESAFDETEKTFIIETEVKADPNPQYGTNCGDDTADRVFLLSYSESRRYFDYTPGGAQMYKAADEVVHPDLISFYTPYALSKNAYSKNLYNSGVWWCRTQGYTGGDACNVSWAGYISSYGHYTTMSSYGVRPVITLDLSMLTISSLKTARDIFPSYAAGGETSADPIQSEEPSEPETSVVSSHPVSSEESEETSVPEQSEPQINSEPASEDIVSQDIVSAPAHSETSPPASSGSIEGGNYERNRFIFIGILVCLLAGFLIFKLALEKKSKNR